MSATLQPVRGMHDALPETQRLRRHVIGTAREIAERYGFAEMSPPVVEPSEVFTRTLGDTSDVVTKETYSFTDRGGESLTLRPEFTASLARAFISGKIQPPCKWFYAGPAFRYERPQKGRLRQFHQIGAEYLGASDPLADVEMLALARDTLAALGLAESVTLEIHSLGDAESRIAYRAALVAYYERHNAELSEESQARLTRNPLRILDSKNEGDRRINEHAPTMEAHFTPDSAAFFTAVKRGLEALGIAYSVNPRLVRGLDYYTHTVFEFTSPLLGAQNTVLAGGRYDGLIEAMGGPATPGIGFAAGVERLEIAVAALPGFQPPATPRPLIVMPFAETEEMLALQLAHRLRQAGFTVELETRGNIGKRMKRAAERYHAHAVLLIGEEERQNGTITVKHMDSGEQQTLTQDTVLLALSAYLPSRGN